jgi:hypothetical protein
MSGWLKYRLGYGVEGTIDADVPTSPPQVTVANSVTVVPSGTQTVAIDQTGDNNDVDVISTVLPPGAATDATLQTIDTDLKATQPRSITNFPAIQPISGTVAANPTVNSRSDTYTTPANGATISVVNTSAKVFAIQVKATGAIATAWVVVLEGSLDNVNFTTILTHNTATGDGVILFSGASAFPCLYFRSRLVSDTLGLATNLVVIIMGTS